MEGLSLFMENIKMFGWIIAALLTIPLAFGGGGWGDTYEQVEGAITPLHGVYPNGSTAIVCTVVNVEGWMTTARHCLPAQGKGWVYTDYGSYDGHIASVFDFVVLGKAPKSAPYLRLASETPRRGDEVALVGYGWGERAGPIITIGHAQGFLNHQTRNYGAMGDPHVWWFSNETLIGGQSGGAVITTSGRYVTVGSFFDAHPSPQAWLAGSPSPDLIRELLDVLRKLEAQGQSPAPGNPLVWEDRVLQTLGAPQIDYPYP